MLTAVPSESVTVIVVPACKPHGVQLAAIIGAVRTSHMLPPTVKAATEQELHAIFAH